MKKFVVSIFASALIMFISCGSSGKLAGVNQRENLGLPKWAGEGISFFSADAETYDAYKQSEKGFYACGMSENLDNPRLTANAARLSANRALAGYISTEISSIEKRVTDSNDVSFQQVDESIVNVVMKGARIVDNFTDSAGNVYSLAFISESDLKKNFAGDSKRTNLIDEVIQKK